MFCFKQIQVKYGRFSQQMTDEVMSLSARMPHETFKQQVTDPEWWQAPSQIILSVYAVLSESCGPQGKLFLLAARLHCLTKCRLSSWQMFLGWNAAAGYCLYREGAADTSDNVTAQQGVLLYQKALWFIVFSPALERSAVASLRSRVAFAGKVGRKWEVQWPSSGVLRGDGRHPGSFP